MFHWCAQSISVDSLVAKKDLVTEIVKEQEVSQEKQRVRERTLQNEGRSAGTSIANDRDIREGKCPGEEGRTYA